MKKIDGMRSWAWHTVFERPKKGVVTFEDGRPLTSNRRRKMMKVMAEFDAWFKRRFGRRRDRMREWSERWRKKGWCLS